MGLGLDNSLNLEKKQTKKNILCASFTHSRGLKNKLSRGNGDDDQRSPKIAAFHLSNRESPSH